MTPKSLEMNGTNISQEHSSKEKKYPLLIGRK